MSENPLIPRTEAQVCGKPVGGLMRHEREVSSASFSPDGRRVVTTTFDTATFWEVSSGKKVGEAPRRPDVKLGNGDFPPKK